MRMRIASQEISHIIEGYENNSRNYVSSICDFVLKNYDRLLFVKELDNMLMNIDDLYQEYFEPDVPKDVAYDIMLYTLDMLGGYKLIEENSYFGDN